MQTGTISFCDRNSLNIKSNDTKKYFNDKLLNYGIKVLQKHFERFNTEISISKLKSNPYLVSLKSNGNPYLLFLTKFNGNDITLMIDKKIQQGYFLPRMIIDRLCFKHELFKDTLFDGEMIKCGDHWTYAINDIYVHEGRKLESYNCMKRLQLVHSILENGYFPLPFQKYSIQVKKYFKLSELEKAMQFKESLPYTTRGLIFKPMFIRFRDILHNFDDSLIDNTKRVKYSEANRFIEDINIDINTIPADKPVVNSVDGKCTANLIQRQADDITTDEQVFKVERTEKPDVYRLYTTENKPAGHACVRTLKTSKLLRSAFKDTNLTDKLAFRCKYTSDFANKWIPIHKVV